MLELPSYPGYSSQVILVDGIGPRLKALQRLLGTGQSFKLNQCISLFNPHNNSMKEIYYCLHLTDEEAEVKRGYVTSPRSHSNNWQSWNSNPKLATESNQCLTFKRVPGPYLWLRIPHDVHILCDIVPVLKIRLKGILPMRIQNQEGTFSF